MIDDAVGTMVSPEAHGNTPEGAGSRRRRVLVVQPSLQPPGGGNGVAAWILQALQDQHDLGLLTWAPVDLAEINEFYGTAVRPVLDAMEVSGPTLRTVLDRMPFSLSLLKHALLQRRAQSTGGGWDVLFSVNNETAFGRPGIQYVHYPAYRRPRPHEDVRWYHGPPAILNSYYALADRIGRVTPGAVRRNVTLTNSNWTSRAFKQLHGIDTITVYPPVTSNFEEVPWGIRTDGFLCIGRISPEKDLHRVIDILSRVRQRHPHVTLRLVGSLYNNRYSRSVQRRVSEEAGWISLDTDVSRQTLVDLIPRYRYGIHGMAEEHFGMAPAEMVTAGCIVFVPNGGGQVEIVGEDRALIYDDLDDAVRKIVRMLDDQNEQSRTRARLASRRELFTSERFMQTIRHLVDTFPRHRNAKPPG